MCGWPNLALHSFRPPDLGRQEVALAEAHGSWSDHPLPTQSNVLRRHRRSDGPCLPQAEGSPAPFRHRPQPGGSPQRRACGTLGEAYVAPAPEAAGLGSEPWRASRVSAAPGPPPGSLEKGLREWGRSLDARVRVPGAPAPALPSRMKHRHEQNPLPCWFRAVGLKPPPSNQHLWSREASCLQAPGRGQGLGAGPRWGQETTAPSIPLPPAAAPCHNRGSQGWGRQVSAGRRSSEGQSWVLSGAYSTGPHRVPSPHPLPAPVLSVPRATVTGGLADPNCFLFQVTRVTSSLSGFVPGSQVSPRRVARSRLGEQAGMEWPCRPSSFGANPLCRSVRDLGQAP